MPSIQSNLDKKKNKDQERQSVVIVSTTTQQRVSEDYAIPEKIASEALLMLENMNQPNPQDIEDDNDEYALPVSTEKLPDIISEMNKERGIETVVNYEAEIPEDMRLQTEEPTQEEEGEKAEGSDKTVIYDASEFDKPEQPEDKTDNKKPDDGEKSPKDKIKCKHMDY